MDDLPPPIKLTSNPSNFSNSSNNFDDPLFEAKINNPFSKFFNWIKSFLRRNQNITIKIPILGILIALSDFTNESIEFSKEKPLELINRKNLELLLQKHIWKVIHIILLLSDGLRLGPILNMLRQRAQTYIGGVTDPRHTVITLTLTLMSELVVLYP